VVLHDDGVVRVVMAPMDHRATGRLAVRWLGDEGGTPYVVEGHCPESSGVSERGTEEA